MCPVWTLAMAMLCVLAAEVSSQCWESAYCQDLSSEENMLVSALQGGVGLGWDILQLLMCMSFVSIVKCVSIVLFYVKFVKSLSGIS